MFGNALFNPSNTQYASPRRHSHLDVSIAPKLSQRRSTMPVIDVTGMSPGLGNMMGTPYSQRPHTPCFVTPTLGGFSGRRFSYDSPLQTLQNLSSAGLPTINRKAAKRAWSKMSTKKWSRSYKITAILLLAGFAVTLFLVRKMNESSVTVTLRHASCNDETGTCEALEAHHHENNPKENFMELVSQNDLYHSLEEEPSDLWVNRWGSQDVEEISQTLDTPNEPEVNVVEQEPLGKEDLPARMMDYVESVKTFIGDKISGSDSKDVIESASVPPEDSLQISPELVQAPSTVHQTETIPELRKNHVHVLNGVTSYHGNTHHHAVLGEPKPPKRLEPVEPAQIEPGNQQPQSSLIHQQGLPQPPAEHWQVPKSVGPSQINGMPAQPIGHLRPQQGYGVPPAPGMPQQYHGQPGPGMPQQYHGQPAPGMPQYHGQPAPGMPQHHVNPAPGMPQQYHGHPAPGMPQQYYGQQVAPGINPNRYNQQAQNPQYHNQGGIIGHNPHHNGYQNNGQKLPPGVNPQRYMGF